MVKVDFMEIPTGFTCRSYVTVRLSTHSVTGTERGPDIVRMPYIGQKRTISGMRTISEGQKIPMVVILFITHNNNN